MLHENRGLGTAVQPGPWYRIILVDDAQHFSTAQLKRYGRARGSGALRTHGTLYAVCREPPPQIPGGFEGGIPPEMI